MTNPPLLIPDHLFIILLQLWEMACARHVGFHAMPIVCINVDGYYDTFKVILQRAHEDELLYKHPRDIVHFEDTPEAALQWIEAYLADPKKKAMQQKVIKRRSSMLNRMESNLSGSSLTAWRRMASFLGDENSTSHSEPRDNSMNAGNFTTWHNLAVFSAGLSLGLVIASSRISWKS